MFTVVSANIFSIVAKVNPREAGYKRQNLRCIS